MFVERPELSHAETTCKTKHLGRFLVGPKDLSDSNQTTQCPILCSPGSVLPDSQLVTYQALRVVLCLVIHGVNPIPREFFVQFDAMVGPRLTVLADRLAANQSSTLVGGNVFPVQMLDSSITPSVISLSALNTSVTQEEGVTPALEELTEEDVASFSALGRSRFLYWNPCTYAVLTTLHVYTGSGRRQVHGAKLLLDVMTSLRSELQLRPLSWHEEITVRMDPHIWLVARRSNGREVYMSLFDLFGCCQRFPYLSEDNRSLTTPVDPTPEVRLDLSSAGPTVVILKNGRRICGHGCARANTPIVQNKAYFEAKIQCAGRWAIGLGLIKTPLESLDQLSESSLSWVLRENGGVWHAGAMIAKLEQPAEEGDVIGLSYDHVELQFSVNGALVPLFAGQSLTLSNGITGLKGTLYPVVGVADNSVLDIGFNSRNFYHSPPIPDFEQILFEKELL
ncbi:hypothetical protein PHET_07985 [Paragonimus heterotremus]|uniref:SPRY domain-containing protein 7 n=1 Tax=Paragonimus heterotremus TaxID=100268 RepID=A0A8J4T4Q0_9TREM|nr:hypothetical protein PHET_07985 [Paragonimus heterotremus]